MVRRPLIGRQSSWGGGEIQTCIIQNKYKYSIIHDTRADRLYFHALLHTSWPPREYVFFLAHICHAITDPPVTKIRLWASFGVWIRIRLWSFRKNCFLTTSTPKTGKIFTLCFGPKSQSIGRGRLSREGALDHRESRERRDKIFAAKTENAKILDQKQQFSMGNFYLSGREKTNF